jgi:L-2-hydroxycarboxylate dehydrogenase (NAD+)
MENKTYLIPVETLQSFIRDVFLASGLDKNDAEICADVLITSDLRGIESHGIGRLKMYYDRLKSGQIIKNTQFELIRESPTTAVVDAHHSIGMVIGSRSMQLAIDKARKFGMGSVAVRNSTHFGIDGYYALMAIKNDMIGMSFTNARPSIAPTFGVQPMLGTNPIAFGAPSDEDCPFIFDGATSIIQRGKVEIASREEKPLQEGYVINQKGESVTDPDYILQALTKDQAALLPLGGAGEQYGGYKGYDLATMVEILSASLQGGSFLHGLSGVDSNGKPTYHRLGHFFMAIKIENFIDLSEFKKITGGIIRDLRNSTKEPGAARIYTAGEKEFDNEKIIRKQGVPVIPNLQKEFKTMQAELGLSQYQFPF